MKLFLMRQASPSRHSIRRTICLLLAIQISATPLYAAAVVATTTAPDNFKIDQTQVPIGGNGELKIEFITCPDAGSGFNKADGNKLIVNRADLEKQGITLDVVTADSNECLLTVKYQVAPNPSVSKWDIVLKKKDADTTEAGTISMIVVGVPPLPRKPIPEGMQPEVDIMWRVVPQRIVKDNFGTRVGKFFYCVEVIIGNNSGFDLQIVTVGFEVGPIGEQTRQMADLLNKSFQETDTSSKVLLSAAQARTKAAVDAATAARDKALYNLEVVTLAAKKKPTATNEDEKKNFCDDDERCRKLKKSWEASEKVAAVSAAQADIENKHADDVAKAQRFTVEALRAKRDELAERSRLIYQTKIPATSYRMTRGSLEHGQFWSFRNLTINGLKAFGPFLTGFTPYFRNINRQKNFSEAINIISNPLEKGFEAVVPDETVDQLQRLDEQILRDGMIIQNNRQVITHAFIPKDNLGLNKELKKYRDDPLMVTLALGKLHIVGDQIKFINRVSVTSGGSGEVRPRPIVSGNTSPILTLGEPTQMTLTGRFLEDATLVSEDPEIRITKQSNTEGSFTANVEVSEKARRGDHNFILTTDGGERLVRVRVAQPSPKLTPDGKAAEPELTDKTKKPKALLTKEERYNIKVAGQFLEGANLLPVGDASKLRFENLRVAQDFKSFTVDIIVPENTPAKPYQFRVANAEHSSGEDLPLLNFTIEERGKPEAKSLGYGEDGTADPPTQDGKEKVVTVLVKGTNLVGATLSINGIAGEPVIVKDKSDDVSLVARVSVPETAVAKEYDVTVKLGNTPADNKALKFKIVPPQAVVDTPPQAEIAAAQSKNVTLTGKFTKDAKVQTATEGWKVEKVPAESAENKLVVKITAPATFTSPANVTFEVINVSTGVEAKPARVTVQVKTPAQ